MILVLNMTDVAHKNGLYVNLRKFSHSLGDIPVIEVVANRGEGLEELKEALLAHYRTMETTAA